MPLFTHAFKWVSWNLMLGGGGEPCDGLVSHPGWSKNIPSHLLYNGKWDKLWQGGTLKANADFTPYKY